MFCCRETTTHEVNVEMIMMISGGSRVCRGKAHWSVILPKFLKTEIKYSGGSKPPPPGVQILSISCSFWENLAKLCVHAPPPPPQGSRPHLGENAGSVTEIDCESVGDGCAPTVERPCIRQNKMVKKDK